MKRNKGEWMAQGILLAPHTPVDWPSVGYRRDVGRRNRRERQTHGRVRTIKFGSLGAG